MSAALTHISFYDKAKDSLSSAFNYARNDARQIASTIASATSAASSKAGAVAGNISGLALNFKSHGQRIAEILRMIKNGKLPMGKNITPQDIGRELETGKYAGLDTKQMIARLEESNHLKQTKPKPRPEELKPKHAFKNALALPSPRAA
jgi:hypothetical protein